MQHRDYIILRKVIDEISIGLDMLGDTEIEEFLNDEKLKRAIAGMRDLAAHKYQTLRMEDVYKTAREDFPVLKEQLQNILD